MCVKHMVKQCHNPPISMEMVNIPPLQMVLGDGVFMALFYLRCNGMDNDYTITVNSGGEPFKREGLLG